MFYVYILTNAYNTVLYTGVTNDLIRRIDEHIQKINRGFSYQYNADKLVYFEAFERADDAIAREKYVKKLSRKNKIKLIEKDNSEWKDLYKLLGTYDDE